MNKRIRVEAPPGMSRLAIAQAIAGPDVLFKAQEQHAPARVPFEAHGPLQDAHEATIAAYRRMLAQLMPRVRTLLGLDQIEKAVTSKPLLTPTRVREIARLIRDHHTALVVQLGMGETIDPLEVDRLVSEGVLPPDVQDVIGDAYTYGQLIASLRQSGLTDDVTKWSYPKFREYIKKHPVPQTQEQERAREWAKQSAATYIEGLGNRAAQDFSVTAVEADAELRRKYEGTIRDALQENIERQQTTRKLASELGHATEDWSRDLLRIATTEKQQAFDEGFASKLREEEGDPKQIYVAKIPSPSACPSCLRLHLMEGPGSRPRVFPLSELMDNGTNKGRKQADWQATVGPVHPFCSCATAVVPQGWRFQEEPDEQDAPRFQKVRGKQAWLTPDGKPWRPKLLPDSLRRGDVFKRDLMKSFAVYDADSMPASGCVIRIQDPTIYAAVVAVLARTPPQLFHRDVGVTLITWDHPRPGVALEGHDLGYWTGNEIRLSHAITPEQVPAVLEHELGHAPNVYLMKKLGSVAKVQAFHQALFDIAIEEGHVSAYAATSPIECAAEVTKRYLFDRTLLMASKPRQFAVVHYAYQGIWTQRPNAPDFSWPYEDVAGARASH